MNLADERDVESHVGVDGDLREPLMDGSQEPVEEQVCHLRTAHPLEASPPDLQARTQNHLRPCLMWMLRKSSPGAEVIENRCHWRKRSRWSSAEASEESERLSQEVPRLIRRSFVRQICSRHFRKLALFVVHIGGVLFSAEIPLRLLAENLSKASSSSLLPMLPLQ